MPADPQLVTAQELADFRDLAESRRFSRCDIGRETGATTTVDRLKVATVHLVHTGETFRLAHSGQQSVTIGGIVYETATAVGHLAHDLIDLVDGDVLRITTGEWPETFWRVVKAVMKDQATERRIPLEQIPRPAGWPS